MDQVWLWRKPLGFTVLWYLGLVYFRDELELGEVYLLLSGFWLIYLVGFSPRAPGELSAYSHLNENHERILGSLDARQAGREITGQVFPTGEHSIPIPRHEGPGNRLGTREDHDSFEDADLQRALLLSLHEERRARQRLAHAS